MFAALLQTAQAKSALLTSIDSLRTVVADSLLTQNANLPDDEMPYTANEKIVNDILLRTVAKGIFAFSTQDSTTLESIAAECPLSDGEAVLWARSLLTLVPDSPGEYDDNETCAVQDRNRQVKRFPGTGQLRVYPNPASDYLVVEYYTPTGSTQRFLLFNAFGQLIKTAALADNSNQVRLPLAGIPAGIYWYAVSGAESVSGSGKVLIKRKLLTLIRQGHVQWVWPCPFNIMRNLNFILLLFPILSYSQKHDYIWVSGDSNTPSTTTHGGITIDFNQMPVSAYYNYRKLNMFLCNASICDADGNLQFYTNGCDIAGADDEILENGDNINPGLPHQLHCIQYNDGYASGIQSALILPLPESLVRYYLFHKSYIITSNPFDVVTDKLLYSIIEDLNSTKVVEKNIEILNDNLAFGELLAVKQANEKNWWLITPLRNGNTFYIFNFTKDGIVDTIQQTIGIKPNAQGEGYGQIVFSPDGSKVYRTNPFNPVMVYDFDRETGAFTHFDTIGFEYGIQPVTGEIGCAVSPNGRYLYLGCRRFLYQLDLWAADISASQTTVAEWDGFANPLSTEFWQLQLAPDCKIYGIAGGDTRYFHVIHNPDEPGLACNVEQRGLPLPTPSGSSMPSFPNYRLGPPENPGLPCSPVVSTVTPPTPLPAFSVFPNPVQTMLKVVPNRQFAGSARLWLYDLTGRPVLEQAFEPQMAATELDVSALPPGVYVYEVWCEGNMQRVGKVVKWE